MCTFGHLHAHTEKGSVLDGMAKVKELIDTAQSLGQTFLAITDHGSMSALWEAQKYGDQVGVHIIHGCEFYYEYETPFEKKTHGHLLVLAKDNVGLANMYTMHQWACKENFSRNPRITWDVLKEHSEGLIVTSACLGSEFNQFIMNNQMDKATEWARKFKEVFGEDFYIELQPNSIPEQFLCNKVGIKIARQLGIKIVATNDVHYTFETDCFPHEVLLAMQFKRKMSDPKRFKFSSDDFWLKSEEEMYETFTGLSQEIVQEALNTTRKINDKCTARITKGHYLPSFYHIPEGETERSLLAKEIMTGLRSRTMSKEKDFVKDVQHELDVIDRNGYSGYFLIVQDFVTSAKARGELVGEGRGSGAGSKVAYTTRITEIPPHEYDLLFERFMADGREPDFDVDFSNQSAVFKDLQGKYGVPNVARIIAYGTMTPKSVTRKVMNAFDHPMHIQSAITALIPEGCEDLFDAITLSPALQAYQTQYSTEFDVMKRLQNVTSHLSQHAGGVLIYPDLGKHLPLFWDRDNEIHVAGFDKYMLEDLGHFKFDVLGLETIEKLHACLESIRASGQTIDLATIDLEDQDVYSMLSSGDVSGIFQISAQSNKVMQQQPRSFRDLIAINALIRPGTGDWEEYIARRQGKEWEIHPERLSYLKETEGLITYQEQFLLDCKTFAGWDIAYADKKVRKNRDIRNDTELNKKFIQDGIQNGQKQEELQAIWNEIENSVAGGYSFNKSHSASYAMLTYQTAYLKYHYPEHFYASLMSGCKTDGDGQNEISTYMAECKKRGIRIIPPDINHSNDNFVVTDIGIAYRITTIKHVGESAISHILDLRPILSFDDFMERRDKSKANKAVVINLIKAGAFDFDTPNRGDLMWTYDMSQRTKTQIKKDFQCEPYVYDDTIKMMWEKDVLGMYLSIHPMEKYGFKSMDEYSENQSCIQGGEVTEIYEFHPRKDTSNPKMAFITLNTLYGTLKVTCFARDWARMDVQELFHIKNILLIRGKKQGKDVLFNSGELLEPKLA
jgi:DNA polymerase-3 subunit alpha